jgi:hypothetical protein
MSKFLNRRMFRRLWLRALTVKRPQAIVAAVSLLVGAAIISTLLNLYSDVRRKMTEEFSAYGANVVLAPRQSGQPGRQEGNPSGPARDAQLSLPDTLLDAALIDQQLLGRLNSVQQDMRGQRLKGFIALPRLDVIGRVKRAAGQPQASEPVIAVVSGADLALLRLLNPGWRVQDQLPQEQSAQGHAESNTGRPCAVGANLASRLGLSLGDKLIVEPGDIGLSITSAERTPPLQRLFRVVTQSSQGSRVPGGGAETETLATFVIRGIVSSGAAEDNQVFVPLETLQDLLADESGAPPTTQSPEMSQKAPGVANAPAVLREISLVEIYVPGAAQEVESVIRRLNQAFAGTDVEVRPVRRILYSEGKVLGTIRGLVLWLTGLILVIVALCVTATMTAIVLERRKDIAVMKALGASNRQVMLLFLAEGATLGLLAGIAGCFAGGVLASELAQRLFGVTLHWVWWAWPMVCCATVLLALAASFSPVRSARAVEPAVVLKGS